MSPHEYPAVVIDGSVPRTHKERVDTIATWLDALIDEEWPIKREVHAKYVRAMYDNSITDEEELESLNMVEDDLISVANDVLPDEYVCVLGESNPGDVIVREIGEDERVVDA